MRKKVVLCLAAAIVLGVVIAGYFLLKPANQYTYAYEDGTVIHLTGTTFGTNHFGGTNFFREMLPWQRVTEFVGKLWIDIRGGRAKRTSVAIGTNVGSGSTVGMLAQRIPQPGNRLGCYFEVENSPSVLTNKKWFSIQKAEVLDAGGCAYKGSVRASKRGPQSTKQSIFVGFQRYPAHEWEFGLRLWTSSSTNALSVRIKNLAYKSIQPAALPAVKRAGTGEIVLNGVALPTNSDGSQEWVPQLQISSNSPPGWKLLKPEFYSAYQVAGDVFPPCPHEPVCIVKVTAVTNLLELDDVKSPGAGEVLDLSLKAAQGGIGIHHLYLVGKGSYEMTNGIISYATSQDASEEVKARWRDKQKDKEWKGVSIVAGPNLLCLSLSNLQIYASYVDDKGLPRRAESRRFGNMVYSIGNIVDNLRRQNHALSAADFLDIPALTAKLKQPNRAVDQWLAEQLSDAGKASFNFHHGDSNSMVQKTTLRDDFNRIIRGPSIYEEERFRGVELRPEAKARAAVKMPTHQREDLPWMNRLLLEDAYPLELSRSFPVVIQVSSSEAREVEFMVKNPLRVKN